MDEKKVADERIALRNDQQTTIGVSLDRKGKNAIEPGDKITVASSAVTVLHASFNPEAGVVDVVPVEGAQGPADVSVAITLADGAVMPLQTVLYEVKHPDAEAVVLEPGEIGEKKRVIVVPLPNPEPHEVPLPVEKAAAVKGKEKDWSASGAQTTAQAKYADTADYKAAMAKADADFAPGGAHAGDVAAREAAYTAAAKTRDAAIKG